MIIGKTKKYIEFDIGCGWLIDVKESNVGGATELWLHHEDYGIKLFMFAFIAEEKAMIAIQTNIREISKKYREEYEMRFMDM